MSSLLKKYTIQYLSTYQFLADNRVIGAYISHVFNRHQQHPTSGPGSYDALRVHESRGMNFKAGKV